MKVLVACEFSGAVREAFALLGHDAWSCDLLPSERVGNHLQCNVLTILDRGWDLMVAHPPCTYLCSSGARWWSGRQLNQQLAIDFVRRLLSAPIPRIALENPVGALSKAIRPPDQIIQPWQFGVRETKATCLWLKNLPQLKPTQLVKEHYPKVHYASGEDRDKERSRTPERIAQAMAEQWSGRVQEKFEEHLLAAVM